MGWFGTSNDATNSKGKPTDDGGFIAPDRSARALCWQGRDAFFKCLDQHDIIDSVRQDAQARKACPKELAMFENACVDSWVCLDCHTHSPTHNTHRPRSHTLRNVGSWNISAIRL